MLRSQIYLPEELKRELEILAIGEKVPAAEIVRRALRQEIKRAYSKKRETAGGTLLKIASYAAKGPKDLSKNFFDYAYGKKSSYADVYKNKKKRPAK